MTSAPCSTPCRAASRAQSRRQRSRSASSSPSCSTGSDHARGSIELGRCRELDARAGLRGAGGLPALPCGRLAGSEHHLTGIGVGRPQPSGRRGRVVEAPQRPGLRQLARRRERREVELRQGARAAGRGDAATRGSGRCGTPPRRDPGYAGAARRSWREPEAPSRVSLDVVEVLTELRLRYQAREVVPRCGPAGGVRERRARDRRRRRAPSRRGRGAGSGSAEQAAQERAAVVLVTGHSRVGFAARG